MYESPITIISDDIIKDIVEKQNGYLIKIIHKMGFDVNEEEIKKALYYDRNQYDKGYTEGKAEYQNIIEKILAAGKEGKEALIYINGRLFSVRELEQ